MAQGTRGRLALLGTGLLFCLGCMEPDPKPLGKSAPAKGSGTGTMGSTVKPLQPNNATTYGVGAQPTGFNTNATKPPANTNYFGTGGTGSIGAPTTPGAIGTGASMAPSNLVPGIAPPSNTGALTPSNDPYVAGRPLPSTPPAGLDNPQPPFAPGGPSGAYPAAPTAVPGAFQNFKGN